MMSLAAETSTFRSQLLRAFSLDNPRIFGVAILLSLTPLWVGTYLPLVDLPQHAAQISALRSIWGGDEAMNALFRVNWFTPYLLGYLLLYALALVMPITLATQCLVSLAVVSIPLLTGHLLRVADADERWKWLAIPCSFGFAFHWGFLSFIVAAPLGLLFLIRTIRFVREPTLRHGLGIALFAIVLFFCHVIVLGFASLVSLGYVLGIHYRDLRALVVRALPYTAPLPLIGVWLAATYESEARVQNEPVIFGSFSYRLLQLLAQPAGREDFQSSPVIVLIVTATVLLLPWLSGARLSSRPERWLPVTLALLAFLIAPHYIFSTAYFFQRLGLFLVPLWLMAWDPPTRRGLIDRVAIPVVLLWLVASTARFAAFAREAETFETLMTRIEPDRSVAAMPYDYRSPLFGTPVYLHFPAWYQAIHGGVVDFSFADFYSSMARYREGVGPRLVEDVGWFASTFDWSKHGGSRYDYFIVKSNIDVSSPIFKNDLPRVELVARSGWWWLYRNVGRAGVAVETP